MTLSPASAVELQEIVQAGHGLIPRGGGTKPGLSAAPDGCQTVDMRQLSGLLEYEPGEFTFTAYAGTPISEIAAALSANNQYLPFDPLFVEQGATLGGTVAANTAGPGRYRYGGVRDFILGITFVDGRGRLLRGGGKVVKNAAGFDLPKFMVGSLGRYGILVDLTFKVFPRPAAYTTLTAEYATIHDAKAALLKLYATPFELDALELMPHETGDHASLVLRQGGLPEVLPGRRDRMVQFLQAETAVTGLNTLDGPGNAAYWQAINGVEWSGDAAELLKIPITPQLILDLEPAIRDLKRRYSGGGQLVWLAAESERDLTDAFGAIDRLNVSGLRLRGRPGDPYIGKRNGRQLLQRVKQSLDPQGTFPEP